MIPKLKICGMKHNVEEVAMLRPDYLGFIFYRGSPRFFEGKMPELPLAIEKVGVFVNEEIEIILQKTKEYNLNLIQLHGNESVDYCRKLWEKCQLEQSPDLKLWKVFSVKNAFDFSVLEKFEPFVDAFLFDTKGKNPGGNGYKFNWEIIKKYPSKKPFILSGGIGLQEINQLKEIFNTNLPLLAIDVNSKFEIKAGLKDVKTLKKFIDEL